MKENISSETRPGRYQLKFWKKVAKYFCIVCIIIIGLFSIIATHDSDDDAISTGSVSGSGK